MQAISLLEQQHRDVDMLFDRIDATTGQERYAAFELLLATIEAHTTIEEQFFYPAAREVEAVADLVDRAVSAHAAVKQLIEEVRHEDVDDPSFVARCSLLRENIERHVKEEEFELFPEVAEALEAGRLETLGQQMEQRFRSLMPADAEFSIADMAEAEEAEAADEIGFEPVTGLQPGVHRGPRAR